MSLTPRTRHGWMQIALVALIAARLAWHLASGAGMYWDFINFYNAGRRVFHGDFASLYQAPAPLGTEASVGPGRLDYVGFPLSSFVFAPLGAFPPRAALVVLKAMCAAGFGLGLLTLYGFLRERFSSVRRSDAAPTIYLAAILVFEPFWFTLTIGGQATPIVFLLLALVVAAYTRGWLWRSAVYLSVAMLLKPVLALCGVVFLFAGAWGFLVPLGVCLAAEGALSWTIFGWPLHLEWLRMVAQESDRWAIPWWNNGAVLGAAANFWSYAPGAVAFGLVPRPPAFGVVQSVFRVLLAVLFFWLVRRGADRHAPPDGQRQREVLLAILFSLLFPTVVWPHYLAVAFLPLAVLAAQYTRLSWSGLILVALAWLSTARANYSLIAWLYDALPTTTWLEVLRGGLIGSGTLILLLAASIALADVLGRADPADT